MYEVGLGGPGNLLVCIGRPSELVQFATEHEVDQTDRPRWQHVGVDGVLKQFRGIPYQTISKRIEASEHGFFRPVFLLLKHNESEASQRAQRNNHHLR
jgi:hypothetical protein